MKSIYWTLLLSFGLVACSGNEGPGTEKPESSVNFLARINPMSRATDSNHENGDKIGVFAVEYTQTNTGGVLQEKNYADNVPYVYSGGFFVPEKTPITRPSNAPALFYRAVYPYVSNCKNQFSFTVKNDQYTGRGYTDSDLMTAETAATTEETPLLQFNHRLCNIIIHVAYEERPAGNDALTINKVSTTAYANLNKNTYTCGDVTYNVRAASNGTNSYRVILPPQTKKANEKFATLEIGGETLYLELSEDVTWTSGRQYEYSYMVYKTGEITFTSTINPWNSSGDIEEVVPPTILDEMEAYIPIHRGKNPPNVEGVYLIYPMTWYYGTDADMSASEFYPYMLRFSNQNNKNLTLDYEEKDPVGGFKIGEGAFISGSDNDFSVYFDTEGYDVYEDGNVWNKTALVISGTKTADGIKDLYYAFVMVDKDDPNNHMMEVGAFRIFKDGDNLAANSTWDYFEQTRTHNWGGAKSIMEKIDTAK